MSVLPKVIVTGDIVLDCHLYGGIKTAATSFSEPGTVYFDDLGGAVLSERILASAADAAGLEWDRLEVEWKAAKKKRAEVNEQRQKNGKELLDQVARPEKLTSPRPSREFETLLGLEQGNLRAALPSNLHSFGVWTPHPAKRGAKDLVWRVQRNFGYGTARPDALPGQVTHPVFKKPPSLPTEPAVIFIDDGGIGFRQLNSCDAWPELTARGGHQPLVILKMSAPLCRGDLWPYLLAKAKDRLLVLVSADDLRHEDTQIRRLSWEQCATDTLCTLQEHPLAKELLHAAHVIVNFGFAGALWLRRREKGAVGSRLVFDPRQIEGDYGRDIDGKVYGFQTCVAAGIAHRCLLATRNRPPPEKGIEQGIIAGLIARRRLVEVGHGPVGGKGEPHFPIFEIGQAITTPPVGFVSVEVPATAVRPGSCLWTILAESQQSGSATPGVPLIGLAQLVARHGRVALSHVPCLELGSLFSVDRSEIESLRTMERLIRAYEAEKVQEKPLSLGVFGPPGAGKSFGVKALNKAIFGKDAKLLEFNLSQFKSTDDLIGAFHRVRDEVLKGVTPVAFWDEFDSQGYKWLQYLLAPMQDGCFQQGEITHPIGKCVFIFAGGTSPTLEEFGVKEPPPLALAAFDKLSAVKKLERREHEKAWREFRLLKGPDFISRLHGQLDVLGPNPRTGNNCSDVTWPIRRALILRAVLKLDEKEELQIDPGLLYALLGVESYTYGSRSFEKIINALKQDSQASRLHRSALLPDPLLARETDIGQFQKLVSQRNAFKSQPNIELLAAAVHQSFLDGKEKADLEAKVRKNPNKKWTIHPAIEKAYQDLTDDFKAANRAAARRIPDHLSLINFVVVPRTKTDDARWKQTLKEAIKKHVETLAQAEHLGWCAERIANGWTFASVRDNLLKHHPLLVDWAKLSESDQNKDRNSMRGIPAILEVAGFKAVAAVAPQ